MSGDLVVTDHLIFAPHQLANHTWHTSHQRQQQAASLAESARIPGIIISDKVIHSGGVVLTLSSEKIKEEEDHQRFTQLSRTHRI